MESLPLLIDEETVTRDECSEWTRGAAGPGRKGL